MNFDDWSDLEVNVKICEVYGINFEIIQGVVICSVKHKGDNVISISGSVDYCNNPADMWPIILENKISIEHLQDGKLGATIGNYCHIDKFNNPLRAAAIVFLMMKGVKPDERI